MDNWGYFQKSHFFAQFLYVGPKKLNEEFLIIEFPDIIHIIRYKTHLENLLLSVYSILIQLTIIAHAYIYSESIFI